MAGVPKWISPEAQKVAELIDRETAQLLAESGLPRVNPTGAARRAIAALVQWAIDERIEQMGKGLDG